MNKPRIAVMPRLSNENLRQGVNSEYMEAILKANGFPYMIPLNANIDEVVNDFDGFLVTGGEDLHPHLYNETTFFPIETTTIEIDHFELKLIHAFYKEKKPIFGICRGIQSINVAFGGTLYQDLKMQYPHMRTAGHLQHQMQPPLKRNEVAHTVHIQENTILSQLVDNPLMVNTYHHQNIKDLASNFTISAISDDGLIEAIEFEDIIFAVQWHPERLTHHKSHAQLFNYFVECCKKEK